MHVSQGSSEKVEVTWGFTWMPNTHNQTTHSLTGTLNYWQHAPASLAVDGCFGAEIYTMLSSPSSSFPGRPELISSASLTWLNEPERKLECTRGTCGATNTLSTLPEHCLYQHSSSFSISWISRDDFSNFLGLCVNWKTKNRDWSSKGIVDSLHISAGLTNYFSWETILLSTTDFFCTVANKGQIIVVLKSSHWFQQGQDQA